MEPPNHLVLYFFRSLTCKDIERADTKTDKAHQSGQARSGRKPSHNADHDAVAQAVTPAPFVGRRLLLLLGLISHDADHGESLFGRQTRETLLNSQHEESIVAVDRQEVVLEGLAFLLGEVTFLASCLGSPRRRRRHVAIVRGGSSLFVGRFGMFLLVDLM